MFDTHLSRRRFIAAGSGIAVGTTGLYAVATREAAAQADVTVGDGLSIEDATFSPDDAAVFSPWVLISGSWSYSVQATPAKWECYLLIYRDGDSEPVAVTSGETAATEDKGTYGLRGAVTAASFFEPADFAVPDGQDSITVPIEAEIAFVVRDADDSMLAQDRAADESAVTVNSDGEIVTAVSGTGEMVMQDDSDSPTPTPTGGG